MAENVPMFRTIPSEDFLNFAERLSRHSLLFQVIARLARHPETEPDGDLIALAEMAQGEAEALSVALRCAGVDISGGEVRHG